MRYVLIDRIVSLEPGRSLTAYKQVTASDDLLTRYAPGVLALPSTMVLEAMAQAAGLLLAATIQAAAQPVLAKVRPFTARGYARPGDRVDVRVGLDALRKEGCRTGVTASIEGRPLAEATIYLSLVPLGPDAAAAAALLRSGLAEAFPEWFGHRPPAGGLQ
jgi:3-hydroxymyristoyl/3-hydroxydecanoyl-(acyl carrier protein) dehydratase